MKQRKGLKYRLKVRRNQRLKTALKKFVGADRWVWNRVLYIQQERLDNKDKLLTYPETASLLVEWKKQKETAWLKEIPAQALQQTLMQLDRAFKDAFSKKNPKKFPRFKKKGMGGSFRYPQGFKVDEDRVFLPKIGWVRFWNSRGIDGVIKSATISERGDRWFISFGIEKEVSDDRLHPSSSLVGIDL